MQSRFLQQLHNPIERYELDASGFIITQLGVISSDALRWLVSCGSSHRTVNITMAAAIAYPRGTVDSVVKRALQQCVDSMWSTWMAL